MVPFAAIFASAALLACAPVPQPDSIRYVAAVEYDYERIPVPDVTQGQGPDSFPRSPKSMLSSACPGAPHPR